MNESELIVQAMKMGTPKSKKKKIIPEIEPHFLSCDNDAIAKLAKECSSPKKKRNKPVKNWESYDFLQYFSKSLTNHGIILARIGVRDREDMSRIYDELVRRIGNDMNNFIMRDYLDWWVGIFAKKMHGRDLYAANLLYESYINQFIEIKFKKTPVFMVAQEESPAANKAVAISDLYQMGGLSMLLRTEGIVIAAKFLRDKDDANWMMRISESLHDLPRDAAAGAIRQTVSKGPYPLELMVDFVSIARPAIEFHRLKEFLDLSYKDHFKN